MIFVAIIVSMLDPIAIAGGIAVGLFFVWNKAFGFGSYVLFAAGIITIQFLHAANFQAARPTALFYSFADICAASIWALIAGSIARAAKENHRLEEQRPDTSSAGD